MGGVYRVSVVPERPVIKGSVEAITPNGVLTILSACCEVPVSGDLPGHGKHVAPAVFVSVPLLLVGRICLLKVGVGAWALAHPGIWRRE